MALIFMDGFDHYATADILKKWSTVSATSPTIGTSSGRRSSGAMVGGTNVNATKTIGGTSSALIIGFAYTPTSSTGGIRDIIQFREGGGVHVSVSLNPASGQLLVYRDSSSGGTVLATGTSVLAVGGTYYLELKATIGNAAGAYELRINGATEVSASGVDTQNGGTGVINAVMVGSSGTNGTSWIIDDLYICNASGSVNNDFLGDCRIDTLMPAADGTYSQFTCSTGTSHYALVDEAAPNTSDYNAGAAAGDRDSYGLGNLAALTSQTIYGVQVSAALLKDDTGYRTAATMVRSGSSNSDGAAIALGTSQVIVAQVFETDPDGAIAWTESSVNAMEAGVKVVA